VLSNLLINAAQAFVESGIGDRISVHADYDSYKAPRLLRIAIEDNGPGIPADIVGKVFDPLFTTKSAGKGTGVGLALCNRIVTSHGGTISVQSTPGSGARFVVDLPVSNPSKGL
jgi:signal transduction histidine kinase